MRILLSVFVAVCLSSPPTADANPVCRWVGLCLYLSPGFAVTVVDAETGKPLPEVYGWAEWTQYGAHGRGGALMVQDATSGADGRLVFPRWGPRLGSSGGVLLGYDPAVILFKPAYATLLVQNGVPLGADHHAAIRGMSHNGETLRLQPFRGTPVNGSSNSDSSCFRGCPQASPISTESGSGVSIETTGIWPPPS